MMYPDWLPPLVEYNDYGDWDVYLATLYDFYLTDFVKNPLVINGKQCQRRRLPTKDNKDKCFWHFCGEENTQARTGNFNRHKRLRWIKPIVINRGEIITKVWVKPDNDKNRRICFWFNDEYLVIIEERPQYFLWITAYPTEFSHTRRKLTRSFQNAEQNFVL